MSSIHLIHGFMGFGKTTLSKRLEKELPAIRLTHDEWMIKQFGRGKNDFTPERFSLVDEQIKKQTILEIKNGNNVILDYGFWEKATRKKYYDWAKTLTDDVIFHALQCDLSTAKKRVLLRTEENKTEFYIDEELFYDRLKRFEPMTKDENIPVIFYDTNE